MGGGGCGLNSVGSRQGTVRGCYDRGNEPLGVHKMSEISRVAENLLAYRNIFNSLY
jgi:hypothetical protein